MTPMSCPECHSPMDPCFANVSFRGDGRAMHLRLHHVPAMWCHHCGAPHLEPAMRRHLAELGLGATDGWTAERLQAA